MAAPLFYKILNPLFGSLYSWGINAGVIGEVEMATTWGSITGTLSSQTDLSVSLAGKAPKDGSGAFGAWAIDITGNASSADSADSATLAAAATALATPRTFSLTGAVTASGVSFNGSANVALDTTIANDAVANSQLANMAQATIKGRVAATGTGDPVDMTPAQVRTTINVADGATANSADATLLARANHTGTQAASTISDFAEAVDDRVAALMVQGSGVTLSYNDGAGTLTASASGGVDPWTYVKLGSDFTTSSATAVDVTGLAFTPAANTQYVVEGQFLMRTATATVGPRPGAAFPTGMTDGVAECWVTSSATAQVFGNGNVSTAPLTAVGGLPNTTQSWPAGMIASMVAGASPSGNFRVQLASETAGTNVTVKAGSWIRYRTI